MKESHLNRARRFLQRRGIELQLKDGSEKVLTLHARHHPSSVVRYLIQGTIPFENLHRPASRESTPEASAKTYRRPSLYLFWHAILCLLAFSLGFYLAGILGDTDGVLLSLPFFALAVYWAYVLQTRFCYVTLDGKGLHVHSMGRVVSYPYERLLKINFDFAREQQFTHVMEVLETDYRYHLYYIGRVPRTHLQEICQRLCRAGIDATCSLNTEKRYYGDVYHVQ